MGKGRSVKIPRAEFRALERVAEEVRGRTSDLRERLPAESRAKDGSIRLDPARLEAYLEGDPSTAALQLHLGIQSGELVVSPQQVLSFAGDPLALLETTSQIKAQLDPTHEFMAGAIGGELTTLVIEANETRKDAARMWAGTALFAEGRDGEAEAQPPLSSRKIDLTSADGTKTAESADETKEILGLTDDEVALKVQSWWRDYDAGMQAIRFALARGASDEELAAVVTAIHRIFVKMSDQSLELRRTLDERGGDVRPVAEFRHNYLLPAKLTLNIYMKSIRANRLSDLRAGGGGVDRIDRSLVEAVFTEDSTVEPVLQAAAMTFNESAREKGIKIEVHAPDGYRFAPHLRLGKIAVMLHNLISNAITHGKEHGDVRLKLLIDEDGKNPRIVVEDNGTGMTPEYAEDYGEHIEREDGDSSRSEGTPIGARTVKDIVQAAGWRLDITTHKDTDPVPKDEPTTVFTIHLKDGDVIPANGNDIGDYKFGSAEPKVDELIKVLGEDGVHDSDPDGRDVARPETVEPSQLARLATRMRKAFQEAGRVAKSDTPLPGGLIGRPGDPVDRMPESPVFGDPADLEGAMQPPKSRRPFFDTAASSPRLGPEAGGGGRVTRGSRAEVRKRLELRQRVTRLLVELAGEKGVIFDTENLRSVTESALYHIEQGASQEDAVRNAFDTAIRYPAQFIYSYSYALCRIYGVTVTEAGKITTTAEGYVKEGASIREGVERAFQEETDIDVQKEDTEAIFEDRILRMPRSREFLLPTYPDATPLPLKDDIISLRGEVVTSSLREKFGLRFSNFTLVLPRNDEGMPSADRLWLDVGTSAGLHLPGFAESFEGGLVVGIQWRGQTPEEGNHAVGLTRAVKRSRGERGFAALIGDAGDLPEGVADRVTLLWPDADLFDTAIKAVREDGEIFIAVDQTMIEYGKDEDYLRRLLTIRGFEDIRTLSFDEANDMLGGELDISGSHGGSGDAGTAFILTGKKTGSSH